MGSSQTNPDWGRGRIALCFQEMEFGMIACLLVIPLALICGPLRGIPFYWQLLDCSFGVIGLIPLAAARRLILRVGHAERGS